MIKMFLNQLPPPLRESLASPAPRRQGSLHAALASGEMSLQGKNYFGIQDPNQLRRAKLRAFNAQAGQVGAAFDASLLRDALPPIHSQSQAHDLYKSQRGITLKSTLTELSIDGEAIPGIIEIQNRLEDDRFTLESITLSHATLLELLDQEWELATPSDRRQRLARLHAEDELFRLPFATTLTPNSPAMLGSSNAAIRHERDNHWRVTGEQTNPDSIYKDLNRRAFTIFGKPYNFVEEEYDQDRLEHHLEQFFDDATRDTLTSHYHQALSGGLIYYALMQHGLMMDTPNIERPLDLRINPQTGTYAFYGEWSALSMRNVNAEDMTTCADFPGKILYRFDLIEEGFVLSEITTSNTVLGELLVAEGRIRSEADFEELKRRAEREEVFNRIAAKIHARGHTPQQTTAAIEALLEVQQDYANERPHCEAVVDTIRDLALAPSLTPELEQRVLALNASKRISNKTKRILLGLAALTLVVGAAALAIAFPQFALLILPVAVAATLTLTGMAIGLLARESKLDKFVREYGVADEHRLGY